MKTKLIAAAGLAISLSGCMGSDLSTWSGSFQGTFFSRTMDGTLTRKSVIAQSTLDSTQSLFQIILTDSDSSVLDSVSISFGRRGQIYTQSTRSEINGIALYQDSDGVCYAGITNANGNLRICPMGTRVDLEELNSDGIPTLSIHLEKAGQGNSLMLQSAIKLDDAIAFAKAQSYTSRLQYQSLLQARETARENHLNLIPHLNLNTVIALVTPYNVVNLVTAVRDLVPFMFPDLWLRARASTQQAEAQKQAGSIMKMETISQVEELSILQWEEAASITLIDKMDSDLDQYAQQVEVLERLGAYPGGTSEGLRINSISMKKDLLGYQDVRLATLRNIGETLGTSQENTITDINIDSIKIDFANLATYNRDTIENAALTGSYAIKQMNALINSARTDRVAASYSWMDPAVGLTAGMGAMIAVSNSRIQELQVQQQQTISTIKSQVADILGQWETTKNTYALSTEELRLQKLRLEKVQVLYRYGRDVSAMDLVNAIQEENKSELGLLNTQASLLVLDSRIRKVSFGKNYQE